MNIVEVDASMARVVRTAWLLFVMGLVSCTTGFAQSRKSDEQVKVDKVFSDFQKAGSPGCAVGVFRDGRVIYTKGYGLASVELNSPISPQTVFDIGSTSKQFTASSILLLEKEGKLSVNDDVRKYIPELPDYSKNGGGKITILNLLNHTSGLRDYLELLVFAGTNVDSVTTDEDALALVTRQRALNFAPGTEWAYSNTGYFLLSVIVKRVSHSTLREFASTNIFQPLGMTHTTFRDDHTMLIPHRALAYDPAEKGGYKLDVSYFEQLGDGAVHTSVEDLAKWDENFYSGQVGGKSFLEELQTPGELSNGKKLDYAKGLMIEESRGLHVVRHGGAWGGYRAELLRFPDQHFSVACLCNLANANPEKRADDVAEIYLSKLMKPKETPHPAAANEASSKEVALSPAELGAVAGMYRDEKSHNVARVSEKDGKPQIEIYGRTFGLRALSPTEFVLKNFPVEAKATFELGSDHAQGVMKLTGDEFIKADYQRVTEASPTNEELASYAGDYSSDELGVVYRLRVADGKLELVGIAEDTGIPHTGMAMPKILRPTILNEFQISDEGITIDFSKKDASDASGFELNAGRIRGITFVRTANLGDSAKRF